MSTETKTETATAPVGVRFEFGKLQKNRWIIAEVMGRWGVFRRDSDDLYELMGESHPSKRAAESALVVVVTKES